MNCDEKFSELSETENKSVSSTRNDFGKIYSPDRVTFESLAKSISDHGFVDHLEEIAANIVNPVYRLPVDFKRRVIDWTIQDVTEWINSLNFLAPDNEFIARSLEQECVNGMALMDTSLIGKWSELGLAASHYFMIRCIFDGWTRGYGKALICPPGVPAGVVAGITADLSYCSVQEARELVEADNQCIERGIGYIYGQLVVLGYKEHRIQGDAWQPVGWSNDKFVMKRRKLPNGIRQNRVTRPDVSVSHSESPPMDVDCKRFQQTSHTVSISYNYGALSDCGALLPAKEEDRIVFEYVPDPSKDLFQVGRVATNDFIVKGPLHYDNSMVTCGPVSRYACRIEVERRAPFRAFVFAAGFNITNDISLGLSAPKWFDKEASPEDRWRSFDALTTYGVKLWQPEMREWCEISVQGNVFRPRVVFDEVGERMGPRYTNELTDGSIIDICGAVFLFQNPVSMAELIRKHVNPADVISSLNSLHPQCPVLFNSITFSYIDCEERVRRAYHRLETSGESFSSVGPMHIPTTNYDHVEEEHRSYVFPSCGHVHGYHKSLQDRPCPLCRKKGAFVPIAFAFEPAICFSARPTHVFNPCGHVASRVVCEKWSRIPMHSSNAVTAVLKPLCPFCATILNGPAEGGPYNRLILQTESGEAWESNEEDTSVHPPFPGPSFLGSSEGQGRVGSNTTSAEHVNSCHMLLYLKDQATMDAKLKRDGWFERKDLAKMRVTAPAFPKYTPQLD